MLRIFNTFLHIFNKYLGISICGPHTDMGKNPSKTQVNSYPSLALSNCQVKQQCQFPLSPNLNPTLTKTVFFIE